MANVMKNQDNGNTVAVVIVRTCLHILEDVKSHCEASYSIDEKSDFSKGFKSGADLMKSTFLKKIERAERLIQDVGVLASCGLFEFPAEKKDEEETIHIYKNIFVPGAISAAGVGASSKTN